MISPIININGTSADDLIAPRREAMDHLADAIEALTQVTPHGRDYPGDSERCVADRNIHYARIQALREMWHALVEEALAIKGQAA